MTTTQAPAPSNDDSAIRASLLDLGIERPLHPIPMVARELRTIASATTLAGLDQISNAWNTDGSNFSVLGDVDQETLANAWVRRERLIRLSVAWSAIWGSLALLDSVVVASPTPAPNSSVENALANVAAEGERIARVLPNAPVRAARIRPLSPEAVAESTLLARQNGARLAGYDGRVIDPGQGIGTIIAFGNAIKELDPVSGQRRQRLIAWSAVEAVRAKLDLPEKAFGSSPGTIGMLGEATGVLNHGGYVARNVRKTVSGPTGWKIGHFDNRAESESMGKREVLISLDKDGAIVCDNPTHPGAAAVIADYQRRVDATLIPSDDLRTRIEACLVRHYGARNTDMGIYVAPHRAGGAVDLVVALRPIAGRKIRAWSHTDRESIADALIDSFSADVDRLERALANPETKVGAGHVTQLERLRSEASGLSRVLGPSAVALFQARFVACDATIQVALDALSARAANLEMT